MQKTLFEEIFISDQDNVDYSSSELESVMNLKNGVITDEVMEELLVSLSKYDAEKLRDLETADIAKELESLGISDNDYSLFKMMVGCEGYDFSKTIKRLELKLQTTQRSDDKK